MALNQFLWSVCAVHIEQDVIILYSLPQCYFMLSFEFFAIKLSVVTLLNFNEPFLICINSLNSLYCPAKYRDHVQNRVATLYHILPLQLPSYGQQYSHDVIFKLKPHLDEQFAKNLQNTCNQ